MRTLELWPIASQGLKSPTDDQIVDAVLEITEDRGDAGLHYYDSGRVKSSLVLTRHSGLGYCVALEGGPQHSSRVLTATPDDHAIVEAWVCQNFVRMPKSHFVTSDLAVRAALAFAHDQDRLGMGAEVPGAQWIDYSPEEPK